MDSKSIPTFLAQVSNVSSSPESTISLYEILARNHGPTIVSQIENIMIEIVKTLSSKVASYDLQQACSKVVSAIARYAIDPTTAEERKRFIIHSLCQPLSDSLLGSQENLSSGAALCLQALVESDNWRFSSNETVNEVCQRVAVALEKHSQTNSHLALAMALAKQNSLIFEAYARMFISSGLQLLDAGFLEENPQKQLSAIQMVNCLMRCLDPKSIVLELDSVIKELDKCQSDRFPNVTVAAFEALQIAKRISAEKDLKFDKFSGLATPEDNARRTVSCSIEELPRPFSPESPILEPLVGYDYLVESPIPMNEDHQSLHHNHSIRVNRKLWRRSKTGLDVSLKDGLLSEISHRDYPDSKFEFSLITDDQAEHFSGFQNGETVTRSTTPSPQRSNSRINLDEMKICSTPRELVGSLQDSNNSHQNGRVKTSAPKHEQNDNLGEIECSTNQEDGGLLNRTEDVLPYLLPYYIQ